MGSEDLDAVRSHRIVPLIRSDWIAPSLRAVHREEQRAIAVTQLRLEAELVRVLGLFGKEGIESRVLKGLATGNLDYPRPGMRQTGDVDLLVRPDAFERVDRVLRGSGYAQHHLAKFFDPLVNKGMTYVNESGLELDVHTRLTKFAPASTDELMVESQKLDGIPGVALSKELRLLHAAGHLVWSSYGHRRLSGLVDVLAARPNIDDSALLATAMRHGLTMASAGLELADHLAGRHAGVESWPSYSNLEQRVWFRPGGSSLFGRLLALTATTGRVNQVKHAWDMVPKAEYVAASGGVKAYAKRVVRLGRPPS